MSDPAAAGAPCASSIQTKVASQAVHPPIDEASAARAAESSLSTGRTSSLAISMPLQPPSKEGDGSLRKPYRQPRTSHEACELPGADVLPARAAKLRGQRNQCRRESAREVVCPVLINETDDPGVKEAVGFR
jgi:hypothetical protein